MVISIHFLSGAYHATPWGKHVNEGIPEWPPSSWRLLRSIIATWKNIKPEFEEEHIVPILQKLASELPTYHLPDASVSHTRHYMPTNNKPTLVLNTFIVVGKNPIHIIWDDITLNQQETDILKSILANMHYFGRAESWCKAELSANTIKSNCSPHADQNFPPNTDLVQVLTSNKNIEFVDIRTSTENEKDALNAITATTKILQENKYKDPPGGRWVWYTRPKNCFEGSMTPRTQTSWLNGITIVRYAVVGSLRPPIRDTLRVGDLARSACMSKYGQNNNGEISSTFSGKDGEGKPLKNLKNCKNHKHAFYLPTYETQNDEIDHLTIIALKEFNKSELDVLLKLNKLYSYNMPVVNLVFQGCGNTNTFSDIPILKKSRMWISATPLILSRHVKYRGSGANKHIVDGIEEQIRREIQNRYCSNYKIKNIKIDNDDLRMANTNTKTLNFFRWRRHGSIGDGRAYKVKIEFADAVQGPIMLGYASHFGLGMFIPEEE